MASRMAKDKKKRTESLETTRLAKVLDYSSAAETPLVVEREDNTKQYKRGARKHVKKTTEAQETEKDPQEVCCANCHLFECKLG